MLDDKPDPLLRVSTRNTKQTGRLGRLLQHFLPASMSLLRRLPPTGNVNVHDRFSSPALLLSEQFLHLSDTLSRQRHNLVLRIAFHNLRIGRSQRISGNQENRGLTAPLHVMAHRSWLLARTFPVVANHTLRASISAAVAVLGSSPASLTTLAAMRWRLSWTL